MRCCRCRSPSAWAAPTTSRSTVRVIARQTENHSRQAARRVQRRTCTTAGRVPARLAAPCARRKDDIARGPRPSRPRSPPGSARGRPRSSTRRAGTGCATRLGPERARAAARDRARRDRVRRRAHSTSSAAGRSTPRREDGVVRDRQRRGEVLPVVARGGAHGDRATRPTLASCSRRPSPRACQPILRRLVLGQWPRTYPELLWCRRFSNCHRATRATTTRRNHSDDAGDPLHRPRLDEFPLQAAFWGSHRRKAALTSPSLAEGARARRVLS